MSSYLFVAWLTGYFPNFFQIDWRVRPLVLAVKEWAKAVDINEARFQTLSSYCLTLMVLHFLQSGLKPPVLPTLHSLRPQVFHSESDIFRLPFTCDLKPSFIKKNKMSLGKTKSILPILLMHNCNLLSWITTEKIFFHL